MEGVLYVLHAFCKRSKHGITTPQRELDLIERRWKIAEQHYEEHHA
jgi:phage-related protein